MSLELRSKWWKVIAKWRAGSNAQEPHQRPIPDRMIAARYGVPMVEDAAQKTIRAYERSHHFRNGRHGGLMGACQYIVELEDRVEQQKAYIARLEAHISGTSGNRGR